MRLARLAKAQSLGSHALYLRGKALADLGRYAEALVPLGEVVDADPENIHVRLIQGWCHKRIGRIDLAVRDLETALRSHPDDALLHYNLACYQSLARNKRRALRPPLPCAGLGRQLSQPDRWRIGLRPAAFRRRLPGPARHRRLACRGCGS